MPSDGDTAVGRPDARRAVAATQAADRLPPVLPRPGAGIVRVLMIGDVIGKPGRQALEQLLPDAARALAELLAAAPALRIVATSREPLRIAGESDFDLPPIQLTAVRDANLAAFRAGHAFGETAELFDHPYTVAPYEKPAGVYIRSRSAPPLSIAWPTACPRGKAIYAVRIGLARPTACFT